MAFCDPDDMDERMSNTLAPKLARGQSKQCAKGICSDCYRKKGRPLWDWDLEEGGESRYDLEKIMFTKCAPTFMHPSNA